METKLREALAENQQVTPDFLSWFTDKYICLGLPLCRSLLSISVSLCLGLPLCHCLSLSLYLFVFVSLLFVSVCFWFSMYVSVFVIIILLCPCLLVKKWAQQNQRCPWSVTKRNSIPQRPGGPQGEATTRKGKAWISIIFHWCTHYRFVIWLVALQEDVKSLIFTFCIKQSNFLQLENDDFVAKDDSLTFLTHLATEHVENTFRSGEEQVSKLELLRSFADRIYKHLPHEEANLHPGMKSHLYRPNIVDTVFIISQI